MPVSNVVAGTPVTASFMNTNWRDQVVSTVTSATRPTGTEGQVIYETDTDRYYACTVAGTWVEILKLGALNTWTPTLTQSGALTKTVVTASYMRMGRLVECFVFLSVTSSGTGNNPITVSLPVTAAATTAGGGSGYFVAASNFYPGICRMPSTTTMAMLDATQVTGNLNLGQTGTALTGALISGDSVAMKFTYVAAS